MVALTAGASVDEGTGQVSDIPCGTGMDCWVPAIAGFTAPVGTEDTPDCCAGVSGTTSAGTGTGAGTATSDKRRRTAFEVGG